MTKEDLIFELKKRCALWLNNKTISKKHALECLLGILENEESQPSLPSDLDDVTMDFARELDFFLYGSYTPERFPHSMQVRDEHSGLKVNDWKCWVNRPELRIEMVKHFFTLGKQAGAEWMDGQGWIDDGSMPPETKYESNTLQGHREWTESNPVLAWDSMYGPRVDYTRNGMWMSENRSGYQGQVIHGIIAWRPIPEYKEKQDVAGQGVKATATVGYYNQSGLSILTEPSIKKLGFKEGDELEITIRKK